MSQTPEQPQPQQPPPGYYPPPYGYPPQKSGPSAGKVILWILLAVFVIIPALILLATLVIMQVS